MDKFVIKAAEKKSPLSVTMRVRVSTYDTLQQIAGKVNKPTMDILEEMVDYCVKRLEIVE